MHLNIEGRHLKITKSINHYVKQKIKKVKEHFKHILYAHVILEAVKKTHIAEATITSNHQCFHNKIKTEDLYKSIDILFDKIERQVRQYKEYKNDKIQQVQPLKEYFKELDKLTNTQEKIKIEDVEIPFIPMNDLEAILQLNSDNNKSFLSYINQNVDKTPALLVKLSKNLFTLYSFNDFWEKKEIELINREKFQTNQIEIFYPSIELIEYALDYLEHHQKEKIRIFISMRSKKIMFLLKNNPNNYSLVREKV